VQIVIFPLILKHCGYIIMYIITCGNYQCIFLFWRVCFPQYICIAECKLIICYHGIVEFGVANVPVAT